ncbi:MAG TPA: hypothetical protein VJ995_08820 [Geothermobacteraceae bacterium]|nr:hypothetical protein [Geothermobacteraceae bacterium]
MQRFIIFSLSAILFFSGMVISLRAEPLAERAGLSLFGYQLGMSIEAARSRHPFHEVHTNSRHPGPNSCLVAIIKDLEQPFALQKCALGFKNNRLVKVVATFDLQDLANIKWALEEILGPGEEEFRFSLATLEPIDTPALVWQSMVDQIALIAVPQNSETFLLVLQERN